MPNINKEAKDELALTVIERYRRARDYRQSKIIYQDRSADTVLRQSRMQVNREYDSDEASALTEAFGRCPTYYYPLSAQKVTATLNWKMDTVINSLDSLYTISPTPDPDLDKVTRERIRDQIREDLFQRLADINIMDASVFIDESGELDARVEDYLRSQANSLKEVEQARLVSEASKSAKLMELRMRDMNVEGCFRQAYERFSHDQIVYGRGVMQIPQFKPVLVRRHSGTNGMKRDWKVVPYFGHVDVVNFYPIDDGEDLTSNTGNTELTSITKTELIKLVLSKDKEYFKDQINILLEEYSDSSRNWLGLEGLDDLDSYWSPDEKIAVLKHEGYFSGRELDSMGIKGVNKNDFKNARIEVAGGRTIRATLLDNNKHNGRTYFQAPYHKTGNGVYDAVGLPAILRDTESRVNRIFMIYENNLDWAARPPLLTNPSAFDDPSQAQEIVPGGVYEVEEQYGVTGSMPEPIRQIKSVSAQYHLIYTQIQGLLNSADEVSGIPAYAYSGQGLGRSSLGEYSQRMSNALRSIKALALNEDLYLLEPAFENLFDYLMETEPDLRVGQDINIKVRGMTGLLSEDLKETRQSELLPLIMQGAEAGDVSPEVKQFVIKELLDNAGIPTDQLGMGDPIIDNAIASAAASIVGSPNSATPNIPDLDMRSGGLAVQNIEETNSLNPANLVQSAPLD